MSGEDDEFDPGQMDMDMGPDLGEFLGSLLADEEGRNIVNAIDDIKTQLETTNKLLLKLVAHLTKAPTPTA
jgi:hypothetical protein